MVVTSAIDASRNWTSALSRFGFGTLVLASFVRMGLVPKFVDSSILSSSELSLNSLPVLVLWIMLAMVLGAVATMLGAIGHSSKYGEVARAMRAYRVGKTSNPLLAELLRDANGKYDLASGFMGTLYILLFSAATMWVLGFGGDSTTMSPEELPSNSTWNTAVFGGMGGLASLLIRRSATGSIEAIDEVLSKYSTEQ